MNIHLDELASRLQGRWTPNQDNNIFFVHINSECVLATICYPVALNFYEANRVFKAAEAKALKLFGLVPEYANGGAGPYVSRLLDEAGNTRVVATQAGAWDKQATY